jgi:hypothetical protein
MAAPPAGIENTDSPWQGGVSAFSNTRNLRNILSMRGETDARWATRLSESVDG